MPTPQTEAQQIAIIGAGDLGQLIAHHIQSSPMHPNQRFAGFLDDFAPAETPHLLGKLADAERLGAEGRFSHLICAVGYRHFGFRQQVFERLSSHFPFAAYVHPSSYVDAGAYVGPGSVLLPGCVLDKGARLEANVLLNTGVVIAHDTTVGAHSFLAPGVCLAGFITVGPRVFLGIRTAVIDNVSIVADARTGGGTIVTKPLDRTGLWVGTPARWVKE